MSVDDDLPHSWIGGRAGGDDGRHKVLSGRKHLTSPPVVDGERGGPSPPL